MAAGPFEGLRYGRFLLLIVGLSLLVGVAVAVATVLVPDRYTSWVGSLVVGAVIGAVTVAVLMRRPGWLFPGENAAARRSRRDR